MAVAPSARPSLAASSGWIWATTAVLAPHEHGHVLRPRVGRSQLAAADEHHAARGRHVEGPLEPVEVCDQRRRGELDLAGRGRQSAPGSRGPSGPKSIPCGWRSSSSSERPSGLPPKAVAAMAGAEKEIEQPLLDGTVAERRARSRRRRGRGSGSPGPRPPPRSAPASVALASTAGSVPAPSPAAIAARRTRISNSDGCAGLALEDGRREVGHVAHRERREREVVVRLLEDGGRRQDHVGMPRRRVQVRVDADHQLEPARAGRSSRPASGVVSAGLPAIVSRARTCPVPDVSISSASVATGSSPIASGRPRTRLCQRPVRNAARRASRLLVGGVGEHGAARPVEVAGEHVEHVDEPGCERAVRGRVGADAPVDDRRRGRGELARERQHRLCGDAGERCHPLGGEAGHRRLDEVDPGRRGRRAARVLTRPSREECLRDPREQRRIRARTDRHVEVGPLGRPRPSRVDDDDAAAAAADRLEAAGPVGRRGEAAVRLERVGAEEQQEVGAVDVGDRDRERVPEDEAAGDVLRHLVDRRRRVDVLRPECLDERPDRERVGEVVGVRVPDVDGHCVAGRPRRPPR